MARFFRVRQSDGVIVGRGELRGALADAPAPAGLVLVPWQAGVGHRTHVWDFEAGAFVPADLPQPPNPEDDYRFMRRTGYPADGDQLGALVRLMGVLRDIPEIAAALEAAGHAAEVDGILSDVAAVKAANPKT